MLIAGVTPEEIVLAGEFTRQWKRLGPIIEAEVAAGSLIGNAPRVRPAAAEPGMARLRGTVALVLQKHFGPSGYTSPPVGSRSGGCVLVRARS